MSDPVELKATDAGVDLVNVGTGIGLSISIGPAYMANDVEAELVDLFAVGKVIAHS